MALTLPKELLAKEWDKHKSVLAKLKQPTGMTEKLKAIEKAAADFNKKCDVALKVSTPVESMKECYDVEFVALSKLLKEAEDVSAKAAGIYEKSKVVPKATTEYAKLVGAKAKAFASQVQIEMKQQRVAAGKKAEEILDMMLIPFNTALERIKPLLPQLEKTPTPEYYIANIRQGLRTMAAQTGKVPKLKPLFSEVSKFTPDGYWDSKTPATEHKKKAKEVVEAVTKMENAL